MVNTTRTRNLPDRPVARPPHPDTVPILAVSKFLMDWHLSHPDQQDEYMTWLRNDAAKRAQERRTKPFATADNVHWWLLRPNEIQKLIDRDHPVHTCALPTVERPIPDALSFTDALVSRQTREQLIAIAALYDGRYQWQDGSIAPKRERKVA